MGETTVKQAVTHTPYDGELDTYWNVMFIGDYAVVTVNVEALNETDAVILAADIAQDYYGWDLSRFATEAERA